MSELGYVGPTPWPKHVRQPAGSEQCFAALVASVSGTDVESSHQALVAADLSQGNGETGPLQESVELHVGVATVDMDPMSKLFDGEESVRGFMGDIEEQFVAERSVALLYKKTRVLDDESHHWILMTGGFKDGGQFTNFRVIDPLDKHYTFLKPDTVADRVKRTMEWGLMINGTSLAAR